MCLFPLHTPLSASPRYCLPHIALPLPPSDPHHHLRHHGLSPTILPRLFSLPRPPTIRPILDSSSPTPCLPSPLYQISTATSGTMVLFSSSTALVALMASGRLNLQYAGAFSLASMAASLLGTLVMGRWVR